MKVAFIASEAAPFAKTGGLGDVIGALPRALAKEGVEVSVFLPKYGDVPKHFQEQMKKIKETETEITWRRQYVGIEGLYHEGIQFYFIDNEYYFKRWGLYGYGDDGERFVYFSKAVLEAIKVLGETYDILHAHDWQSAAIPLFLKTHYQQEPCFEKTRSVFTIHNLKYQGVFPYEVLGELLGLGPEHFNTLEFHGKVNLMKGALQLSDALTTVSPNYSEEIKTGFFGEGLDGVLAEQSHKLHGIVNGIDVEQYNPKTDGKIFKNYDANHLEDKEKNKEALQKKLQLPQKEATPVIGLISRFVEQKGFDLIQRIIYEVLEEDLQFIVLGSGEKKYEDFFNHLASDFPEKVKVYIGFEETLAREIYAGSDFFLMPSLFEPCGLGQLIAMHYGTIPIVRETGGLRDTVTPFNEYTGEGNGFSFAHYNAHDLLYTLRRATAFYHKPEVIETLRENAMKVDVSWRKSAREYHSLYRDLIQRR
ncbi:glycogen synthase GlgA [Isachenkonia alkalipeptolytica]|uniref:Glycogen synthase n=1 Tax=Isachenkonia alkalipeptolytica TaxID=2565777 RepID=A0AA43XH68_9CLOT|nr:glycogen synthase GlgA [Isachenkonia alkalipeptolytica]NBG86890.1 glycogen synthase GlgA [Isachenkonia alkalipeptolytica]